MASKVCPICRLVKILRAEIKTCGSPECLTTWRSFTPQQKVDAVERAAEIISDQFIPSPSSDRPRSGFRTINPTDIPSIPKTVERDNDFLRKVFGDDAPGIVKDDDEDDD